MTKHLLSKRWLTSLLVLIMSATASFAQNYYPSQMGLSGNFTGRWIDGETTSGNNGVYWFYNIQFTTSDPQFKFFDTETSNWTEYHPYSETTVTVGNSYSLTKTLYASGRPVWRIATNNIYTFKVDLTNNTLTVYATAVPPKIHAYVDHVALTSSGFNQSDFNNKTGVTNSSLKEAAFRYVIYDNNTRQKVTSGYSVSVMEPDGGSKIATYNGSKFSLKSGATSGQEKWKVKFSKAGEEDLYVPFDVTCSAYTFVNSAADTQKELDGTSTYAKWQSYDAKRTVWGQSTSDYKLEFYSGDNPYVKQANGTMNRLIWNEGTSAVSPWGVSDRNSEMNYLYNPDGNTNKSYVPEVRGWINRLYHPSPNLNAMIERHDEYSTPSTAPNKQQITSQTGIDVNGQAKKYYYYPYQYTVGDEFGMPVVGSFYRFYPKQDGTMTIYFLMNGVTDNSNETKGNAAISAKCRDRRTYFLNAKSQSLAPLTTTDLSTAKEGVTEVKAQTRCTINPAFFLIDESINTKWDNKSTGMPDPDWWKECVRQLLLNWEAWGNKNKPKPTNATTWDGMTSAEKQAWKNLANDIEGIHQQPFRNADGSYAVISLAYVKATLNVKAGETYYLTPTQTKTRLCAVDFFPIATPTTAVDYYNGSLPTGVTPTNMTDYVLPSGANSWMTAANEGKHFDVTLKDRPIDPDTWYSFYFPFNVSVEKFKEAFGANSYTLHFNKVTYDVDSNGDSLLILHLRKHFYPQICAGSPVFVRTDGSIAKGKTVKFNNLYYRHDVHETPYTSKDSKNQTWTFNGTYVPCSMGKNTYFIAGPTQKVLNGIYHVKGEKKTAGNRAWFKPTAASTGANVRVVSIWLTDFADETLEGATAIMDLFEELGLEVEKANDCIYNLNGQLVGRSDDFNSLPKGIYIVNGKKIMK